jgi:hypothetical protein
MVAWIEFIRFAIFSKLTDLMLEMWVYTCISAIAIVYTTA